MNYRLLIYLTLLALTLGPNTPARAATRPEAHGIVPGIQAGERAIALLTPTPPVVLPPNPPADLAAAEASRSTIKLTWADQSDDETAFGIERSLDGIAGWGLIATVISNTTTFADLKRTCNTPYFYRVRAYGPGGVSAPSAAASVTILDGNAAGASGGAIYNNAPAQRSRRRPARVAATGVAVVPHLNYTAYAVT